MNKILGFFAVIIGTIVLGVIFLFEGLFKRDDEDD